MTSDSAAQIMTFTLISLIFSTVTISWFLLQVYGVSVAGIPLPESLSNVYISEQNFQTNQINDSVILTNSLSVWDYQNGIGRVLHQLGSTGKGTILIDKIQPDSQGDVINHYKINNSVHSDFSIILMDVNGLHGAELEFKNDGIHIPYYVANVITSSPLIVPYGGLTSSDSVQITTTYNDKQKTVIVNFNDNTFTINNIDWGLHGDLTSLFPLHYGGVSANTLYFVLEEFKTDNGIQNTGSVDIFTQMAAFLAIIGKIIIYNVDPIYLPWELNIILIKTQTVALIVSAVFLARG